MCAHGTAAHFKHLVIKGHYVRYDKHGRLKAHPVPSVGSTLQFCSVRVAEHLQLENSLLS